MLLTNNYPSAIRAYFVLLLCATSAPVEAQTTVPQTSGEIIVSGQRPMLGVRPDRVITRQDVALYGLGTIGELLDELANERGKTRDDVVYLVDGQRVSDLGDIEAYPVEAIESVALLPAGSAFPIGASANQKVVNISLRPKLRTLVGRASFGFATDGGFGSGNGDVSVTDIARPRRINLAARWRRDDALLESERGVMQAQDAPRGLGRFRTLRPALDELELRASVADRIGADWNISVAARLFDGNTRSFLGLSPAHGRIDQHSRFTSSNLDLQLNGQVANWLIAFDSSYGVGRRRTLTGSIPDLGLPPGDSVRTRSLSRRASADISITGSVLELPAGPLSLTLRGRAARDAIDAGNSDFVQTTREVGAGIQIPIARTANEVLQPLGDLTVGVEWSRGRTSRVGSTMNATYSVQWQPVVWLRLSGSIDSGRTPPGVELLSAPLLATPGVRYLDPVQGVAADVVALSGGNPALDAQRGNNHRLSLELTPTASLPLTITADYLNARDRDIITALPPANSLLLLIFPDRFLRDASGRLTQVDTRPLNFARQSEEQLRYGFELNIPLVERTASAGAATATSGGAVITRAPPPGRLQFNLSHVIRLKSNILIGPGFDAVDLLSPNALGLSGTDRPRHEFDFTIGYAERGLGVRLAGQHKSRSFLNLIDGNAPNTLRFSPLTTFSLRTFIEGQRLIPAAAWLQGSRLSLFVANLTNARQIVRDSSGNIPLPYQPAYRDPTGRMIQLEFRKSF